MDIFGNEDGFDGHIKGKLCDQCGREEIFYDGEQYECANCGMIWMDEDDIGEYNPSEYEIHEKMMKDIEKSEKQMFSQSITKNSLKTLFSPISKFFKNQEMFFDESDPVVHYKYMLAQDMLENHSYLSAKKMQSPQGIDAKEKHFYSFMQEYMSAIDELPYNATPEIWAEYLKIDVEEVNKFFPRGDLNIDDYIAPEWVIDNFSIVFSNKINSIDGDAYEMIDEPINMDGCFSMYLLDNEKSYGFIMKHYLSDELKIAERYIEGYRTKKTEFLLSAKQNNLSVLETIMQFVYYAFEGSKINL